MSMPDCLERYRKLSKFDPKVIFNFSNLDKSTLNHLKNVYTCVAVEVICAALGAAINVFLQSFMLQLGGAIGIFVFTFLIVASQDTTTTLKRMGYSCGLAGCLGLESFYLIGYAIKVDPSIVVTAFVTTSVVFVCFSLSALYAERRSMLFLGSILNTALSGLFFFSLSNLFFRTPTSTLVIVYGSMIVSCLFIMYDTQLIVERKKLGDDDFIMHSVILFMDFALLFKQLIRILTNKEKEKRRE